MRRALAPLLFDDQDRREAEKLRSSVVAPARRSAVAQRKAHTKRTEDGSPVHSFQTLLSCLATICKNRIQPDVPGAGTFEKTTQPTALQQQALRSRQARHPGTNNQIFRNQEVSPLHHCFFLL